MSLFKHRVSVVSDVKYSSGPDVVSAWRADQPKRSVVFDAWGREYCKHFRRWHHQSNTDTRKFGSLLSYGLAKINTDVFRPYQIIFLFCGCLTVAFSIVVFLFLPDSPMRAKFLSEDDKLLVSPTSFVSRGPFANVATGNRTAAYEQHGCLFRSLAVGSRSRVFP